LEHSGGGPAAALLGAARKNAMFRHLTAANASDHHLRKGRKTVKKLTIAALVASQALAAGQPALGADFTIEREVRAGTFAGFSLRVPLGGNPGERRLRAGLTVAPTVHSRTGDGAMRMRLGEGLEFGYRSGRPISFSIAGRDLGPRRLAAAQDNDRRHHGLSTGEILLIAGGVIVVTAGVVAVVFIDAINDNSE
jgi:hypothetical protein